MTLTSPIEISVISRLYCDAQSFDINTKQIYSTFAISWKKSGISSLTPFGM